MSSEEAADLLVETFGEEKAIEITEAIMQHWVDVAGAI